MHAYLLAVAFGNQNLKGPYLEPEVVEEVTGWLGWVDPQQPTNLLQDPNWDAFARAAQRLFTDASSVALVADLDSSEVLQLIHRVGRGEHHTHALRMRVAQ